MSLLYGAFNDECYYYRSSESVSVYNLYTLLMHGNSSCSVGDIEQKVEKCSTSISSYCHLWLIHRTKSGTSSSIRMHEMIDTFIFNCVYEVILVVKTMVKNFFRLDRD